MPVAEGLQVGEALARLVVGRSVVCAQVDVEVVRLQAAAYIVLDEGEFETGAQPAPRHQCSRG